MTVWMHKGGGIILRHDPQCYVGFYDCENHQGNYYLMTQEFFDEHCVYIGRF